VVKEEKLFKEIDDTLMDDIIGNHKSLSWGNCPQVSEKKLFWLPWQPEFFKKFNYFNNFGRASCKKHACQVSLNLAKRYWRRSHLNEKVIAQTYGLTNDKKQCHKSSPCHSVTAELNKSCR
jgi:hypothetical protein